MKYFILVITSIFMLGCDETDDNFPGSTQNNQQLSETEIIEGLKEALRVGTGNAVDVLNVENGYYLDTLVKIPIPDEAQKATDKLRDLGFGSLVDDFEESLNRAAEDAADEARPIFIAAIKDITIQDGRDILYGPDDAATNYFRGKTYTPLFDAFKPDIENSLDKVNATQYWKEITTTYNNLPLVDPVETDIAKYTTEKALDGLFLKVAAEEKKIREDPVARVTDILEKVFGKLDG